MDKIKLGPDTPFCPMPAVPVGAQTEGMANFTTGAWCAMANHKPPGIVVAFQLTHYTMQGIRDADLAKNVDCSGRNRENQACLRYFTGCWKPLP